MRVKPWSNQAGGQTCLVEPKEETPNPWEFHVREYLRSVTWEFHVR